VIIQLAKALGHTIGAAFPWDDYVTCLEETLGDNWDTLVEEGYWVDAEFSGADWDAAFETDSAKFEFNNDEINMLADYSPLKPEGDEILYPLTLVPYDTMRLASGYVGSPPFLIKALEDTILQGKEVLVEINPETAKQLGLSEGRVANLTTLKGSARVKIHLSNGIMPGLVALPRGLGHTAYDRFLAGRGVNYNRLSSPIEDPASGHNAAWGIRAKLTKA
jgi:anaerobic selenocysteine-containing dehydrogenase